MDTVVFGRTGLDVSVVGLGCGGHSRLGQSYGASVDDSVLLVRRALDLGITYVDTAHAYGTEEIVGEGVRGRRDEVVLSTKVSPRNREGTLLDAEALRAAVQASLQKLGTDRIDVYHLHGVGDDEYREVVAELVPELERLRDEGLIRFLAISERFGVRCRALDAATRGPRRLLGRDDGGLQPAQPQCARPRVLGRRVRRTSRSR